MSLHEHDFYAWTQQQATALRAMPPDSAFDVETVAAEIEALGQGRLREVERQLTSLFDRIVLLGLQPDHAERGRWRAAARNHQDDLLGPLTPSMPIDLPGCWRDGRRGQDLPVNAGLALEADLNFALRFSDDAREGLAAFREKRSPNFTGR